MVLRTKNYRRSFRQVLGNDCPMTQHRRRAAWQLQILRQHNRPGWNGGGQLADVYHVLDLEDSRARNTDCASEFAVCICERKFVVKSIAPEFPSWKTHAQLKSPMAFSRSSLHQLMCRQTGRLCITSELSPPHYYRHILTCLCITVVFSPSAKESILVTMRRLSLILWATLWNAILK